MPDYHTVLTNSIPKEPHTQILLREKKRGGAGFQTSRKEFEAKSLRDLQAPGNTATRLVALT